MSRVAPQLQLDDQGYSTEHRLNGNIVLSVKAGLSPFYASDIYPRGTYFRGDVSFRGSDSRVMDEILTPLVSVEPPMSSDCPPRTCNGSPSDQGIT